MTPEERFNLIKRNTQEIVTEDELKKLLKDKKQPVVYLGTATTGRPHIAYFIWVLKLADFLKAGFKVKLLLADIHAAMDNTPWDLLEKRYQYYNIVIPAMFTSIGVDTKHFEIVKGSSFQMSKEYFADLLKMATETTVHDAKKAGSDVVKQSDNPKLSGLVYPLMQALDEQYLEVDVQYGGVDQRKILMLAREGLPKIGYRPRIEIMTPLLPGLTGDKMSASKEDSKIDLLDDPASIQKKFNKAFCPEGEVEGNGVLSFLKHVIMIIKEDKKESFTIERPEKWGGTLSFKTYAELEAAYVKKKIHPMDLKAALAKEISVLLEPVRKAAKGNEKLISEAYP